MGKRTIYPDRGSRHVASWLALAAVWLLAACARMGQPDGGWYDETPPRVVGAMPADKATDVDAKRMNIFFNEFIKLENATEKVVVSPPQMEMPEIAGAGRQIKIHLLDSLKPNTTYTIDFSDAISDNNEGNPLGNYTYSFSTGDHIDTLEVAGYVLEAENLEPVKGMLVGLYDNLSDTIFRHEPMLRVSRTDSRGHFVIKGVAPGTYRVYALEDADGNYTFSQKGERIAFNHELVEPSWKPDIRQDTLWRDSLRIDSIARIPYTHFLPDDIVLRAFRETQTDRYLLKTERKQANRITFYYSYGSDSLPKLRGLDFDHTEAFVVEPSIRGDTIDYWLRDSLLINKDTLTVEVQHYLTDTLGMLQMQTDTLTLLSKDPYEKRMKAEEKAYNEWKKKQEKAAKKGEPTENEMPRKGLEPKYNAPAALDPDRNITLVFDTPLEKADTAAVHLYSKHDTLWYSAPVMLRPVAKTPRTYEILGEWRPDVEYSLEVDSAAFTDIYGRVTKAEKRGFKVNSNDDYSTLLVPITGMGSSHVVAQLLDSSDKPVKTAHADQGIVEFFYVKPGTYYLRIFTDSNQNGQWDTGCFDDNLQPETVYYYPKEIECKALWDVTLPAWNPTEHPLHTQKPAAIVKQKADKAKSIRHRNAERAKELGIEYIQKNMGY